MHLGTIRVFAKSSVLSKCTPFFVCELAVIRLGGLQISRSKHVNRWLTRTIPQAAGGQQEVTLLLRSLAGVSLGCVRQLRQTRLKRFDATNSLPKLQRHLRLATQLLPVGPPMHICFICITEPQK